MNTDKLLRVGEVAEILRVSPMTVIRWCDSGHLPCIKIGVSRRIKETDLAYILKSDLEPKHIKALEPVYTGPSAEELGFDSEDDKITRQNELAKLFEDAEPKLEVERAKRGIVVKAEKVLEPYVSKFRKQSTDDVPRKFQSGFDTH